MKSLDAQVLTTAQKSISDLINQRLRWSQNLNTIILMEKLQNNSGCN